MKTGILLINLGTPDAPTADALKRYLAEFLGDPLVVKLPRLIWKPLLHGIVLRKRPAQSAKLYEKIWTEQGSPLLVYSQQLADRLQHAVNDNVVVKLGMRYGCPCLKSALNQLQQQAVDELIVLPLYPQYAEATTKTSILAVKALLNDWRKKPNTHFIEHYYEHPAYIDAMCKHIEAHRQHDFLLFSFHGIPEKCVKDGDPYADHCRATVKAIVEKLNLQEKDYRLVFQSRFGRAKWLQPYCDKTLQSLPNEGIKKLDIVCPGFAVDCLETLEEISKTNAELFMQAGGEALNYISALNDSETHVEMLKAVTRQHRLQSPT